MKTSGAVRVIKGQKVLPDGSTLDEHGIIDGSTVNIVIEPDKEISLKIKLGPKEFTNKVLNSVRVRELKQQLIDGNSVGFSFNNFTLIISADDNDGFTADIPLLEESLPLHLHGVGDETTLRIISRNVRLQLISHRGHHAYYTFPKRKTIRQMSQLILSKCDFSYSTKGLVSIWAFVEKGQHYRKLDDDVTIGATLSDNDVIYLVEDRVFDEEQMILVHYGIKEIGRVGCVDGDSVLSLKLRVQEHLGFPVKFVDYKQDGESLENDKQVLFRANAGADLEFLFGDDVTSYTPRPTKRQINVS